MGVSKVIYGNNTLIDLTSDTVTAKTLLAGKKAHNSAGNAVTGTYSRPLMIHGRVVKQIFCPTVDSSTSYACYKGEGVYIDPYMTTAKASSRATFDCYIMDAYNPYGNPQDYYFSLGQIRFTSGGSEAAPTLVVQMPTTKYGATIAATTLFNAESGSDGFYVSIYKMNDRAYLLMYCRGYVSEWGKCSGIYFRVIYDTGTAVAISGGTGVSSAWAHTATTSSYFRFWMFTLNKDNTQLGIMRFNETTKDETGAYTTSATYYNNYRVKSPATIGLRSTSWTNIYNNTAYSPFYESVIPEVGYYLHYYTNTSYTAEARYFMSNVMGDWYGAQVNATTSIPNITLGQGYGAFLNDEDYLYLQGISLSSGVLKASYKVVIPFGKTTRTNMKTAETGVSNITIMNLSSLANICKPLYDYRTDSATKFRFAKFIDGILIVGISVAKEIHSITATSFSNVEDSFYAVGLYYNLATSSFQIVGATRAGSFMNDNFLGFSKRANTTTCIGDCFEQNSDSVFDYGYNFDTGSTYSRTYNNIRKNWEYDPFKQYVIEYRDSTGGTEN